MLRRGITRLRQPCRLGKCAAGRGTPPPRARSSRTSREAAPIRDPCLNPCRQRSGMDPGSSLRSPGLTAENDEPRRRTESPVRLVAAGFRALRSVSRGMRGTRRRRSRRLRADVDVDVCVEAAPTAATSPRARVFDAARSPSGYPCHRSRGLTHPRDGDLRLRHLRPATASDGRNPQLHPAARCLATAPLVGRSEGRIGMG
jgi:hypothetical protein